MVIIDVVTPSSLSKQEKKLFSQLSDTLEKPGENGSNGKGLLEKIKGAFT